MKTFWPYFNLFTNKEKSKYTLEAAIKIPAGFKLSKIDQHFDGKQWLVSFVYDPAAMDGYESGEHIKSYRVPLTPDSLEQLKHIKIHVNRLDLRNGGDGTVGQGDTGDNNSELDPNGP